MITQVDIARRLNVSQQAVSFALNGSGKLKKETRSYIISEARKMGYRLNNAGRMFKDGKARAVALVVHGSFNAVNNLLLSRLRLAFREDDMHLVLFGAELEDFSNLENPPRIIRELAVDGFLVMYDDRERGELSKLVGQFRIPSIWINQKKSCNCVYPDDYSISHRLIHELTAISNRDIIYYSSPPTDHSHYSVQDRREGISSAARELNLGLQIIEPISFDRLPERYKQVREIIGGLSRPTTVVTYAHEDAERFLLEAIKMGVSVPDELGIACFATERAAIGNAMLTHVRVPILECGAVGYELLKDRIANPEKRKRSVPVSDFVFVRGFSF